MSLPSLRNRISISTGNRNSSLKSILSPTGEALEVLSVETIDAPLHNTKITVSVGYKNKLDEGSNDVKGQRAILYNRLNLNQVIPENAVLDLTDIVKTIKLLNTKYQCDFTTDDLELVDGVLKAKATSLGYYGTYGTLVLSPTIASYDGFYQSITAFGPVGKTAVTKSSSGTIIGSGVTAENGEVTYRISEDGLMYDEIISTTVDGFLPKTDTLVTSLHVATDEYNEEIPWFSITKNMLEYFAYDKLPSDATGKIILEYSNQEPVIIDLENYRDEYNIDYYPESLKAPSDQIDVKIRFKDLNTPLYFDISECTHIHTFYNDGVSDIGYHLKASGSSYSTKLKKIPSQIPKSLVNLNYMFGNLSIYPMFEDGVFETISNWDTSEVKYMEGAFFGQPGFRFNFNTWSFNNVVNMDYMFADCINLYQNLNWMSVPGISSLPKNFASVYYLKGNMLMTDELLPNWGVITDEQEVILPPPDVSDSQHTVATTQFIPNVNSYSDTLTVTINGESQVVGVRDFIKFMSTHGVEVVRVGTDN